MQIYGCLYADIFFQEVLYGASHYVVYVGHQGRKKRRGEMGPVPGLLPVVLEYCLMIRIPLPLYFRTTSFRHVRGSKLLRCCIQKAKYVVHTTVGC